MAPDELVGLLVQKNMYDEALSVAAALRADMTKIFVTLATKAVEMSQESGTDKSVHRPLPRLKYSMVFATYLRKSPVTARLRGPAPALALRYLQVCLERHDSASTHFAYRIAVSDTFFELNIDEARGWKMPQWLVSWEMQRDPHGWIDRAIRWGWITEALDWSIQVLQNVCASTARPLSLMSRPRLRSCFHLDAQTWRTSRTTYSTVFSRRRARARRPLMPRFKPKSKD